MRIRSYLAILIFACLMGAYALEQVLAYHFNHVQALANKHNKTLLWVKDIQRIESTASQFLISSDLVVGSGNTYLIFGTKNMGEYLADEISTFSLDNQFQRLTPSINDLLANVNQINDLLYGIADVTPNGLELYLSKLLEQYDPISLQLSKHVQYLTQETNKIVRQQKLELEKNKSHMQTTALLARLTFFILIIMLWWWANRKICKPLNQLIYSSHRALAGEDFKATTNAPTEIIELSNDFKHLTQTLFHQASHDPLTELQNRRAFERNLNDIINDKKQNYFLCFIDLDYFKTINDTCGHAAGDEILVGVARILKNNVRSHDIVARLGGDEFAILINDCPVEKAVKIANNIKDNICNLTYHWEGETFQLSASIGVAPKITESTTTDLLNSADVACSLAKNAGRNAVHLFDISNENPTEKRQDMLSVHQVNNAISNNLFVLYQQTIVPLQNKTTKNSIEILLRMKNTHGELIGPAAFFPIAERYQLSSKIDRWVINAVYEHFKSNPKQLDELDTVAINLSSHSLTDNDLENFITTKLLSNHLPPKKICFEITETAAITNIKRARLFMDNIKSLGCSFALDDFGSGHSSYAYVKELPTNKIKIDGSFISNMLDNPIDYTAVKSICEIAQTANQEVIAEFVESKRLVDALTRLGVDYGQGYYFSKPEPLK